MKIRLRIETSDDDPRNWEHAGPAVRIGRDPANELAFDEEVHDGVSGSHARIELTPRGAQLTDLGSTNGTFVNDQRIDQPALLKVGDEIRLGESGPRMTLVELELSGALPKPRPVEQESPSQPLSREEEKSPAWWNVDAENDESNAATYRDEPAEPKGPSGTMLMLLRLASRQRALWTSAALIIVCVSAAVAAGLLILRTNVIGVAEETGVVARNTSELSKKLAVVEEKVPAKAEEIYKELLRSVVWIRPGSATGSLIDREQRLVVTNYHVVNEAKEVRMHFAEFRDGELINDRSYYRSSGHDIKGTVVIRDPSVDLALIRLDSLPAGAVELSLSESVAQAGQDVHIVGNTPEASDALWVSTSGRVKTRIHDTVAYNNGQRVSATFILSDSGTNAGDSGSPVVNAACELIAVHSASRPDAREISRHIDVTEVKRLLERVRP